MNQEIPVEETPVDETLTEETPLEETPVEELPSENADSEVPAEIPISDFDQQAAHDALMEALALLKTDTALTVEQEKALLDYIKKDEVPKTVSADIKAILAIMEQNEKEEAEAKALAEKEATEAEQAALEAGEPVDYLKLTFEETQKQTAILEEQTAIHENGNTLVMEQSFMLTIALVVTIGLKVFIDQVTKW